MKRQSALFWQLFFLNLFAAYLPVFYWMLLPPGPAESFLPFAPIAFLILLLDAQNILLATFLLVCFFSFTATLTYLYRQSKTACVIIPITLFCSSLVQGYIFIEFIHGINAIGHS